MDKSVLNTMDPKVLGNRLQQARTARGLTQQQVSDTLGIARTTVTAIEKGERKVQPSELIDIAKLYGRNVSNLVGSREPVEDFAVQFRTTVIRSGSNREELEEVVRVFQRLCEAYSYLEQVSGLLLPKMYPSQYIIDDISPENAAEDVSFTERNRLGLGDGPIINLRENLENDAGLRIFYIPMPSRVSGLFGYVDKLGGCIAINSLHPEERRRWSLAHEYAHFLTHRYQPEISIHSGNKRLPASERFADAFAQMFLMPGNGLRHRFNEMSRRRKGQVTPADICILAHYYFVSLETLSLRLEEMRLLPRGTWDRLRERGFKVREAQKLLGLHAHPAADNKLPLRYQMLAMEAYMKGDLTEGELSRLMEVDRLETRKLVQELTGASHMSEAGELTGLSLDLGESIGDVEP